MKFSKKSSFQGKELKRLITLKIVLKAIFFSLIKLWQITLQKNSSEVVLWKRFSEKFCNILRKKPVVVSDFNNISGTGLQLYQKKTPAQVFFCECCEVFKNTYFEEHLQAAASDSYKKWEREKQVVFIAKVRTVLWTPHLVLYVTLEGFPYQRPEDVLYRRP